MDLALKSGAVRATSVDRYLEGNKIIPLNGALAVLKGDITIVDLDIPGQHLVATDQRLDVDDPHLEAPNHHLEIVDHHPEAAEQVLAVLVVLETIVTMTMNATIGALSTRILDLK